MVKKQMRREEMIRRRKRKLYLIITITCQAQNPNQSRRQKQSVRLYSRSTVVYIQYRILVLE